MVSQSPLISGQILSSRASSDLARFTSPLYLLPEVPLGLLRGLRRRGIDLDVLVQAARVHREAINLLKGAVLRDHVRNTLGLIASEGVAVPHPGQSHLLSAFQVVFGRVENEEASFDLPDGEMRVHTSYNPGGVLGEELHQNVFDFLEDGRVSGDSSDGGVDPDPHGDDQVFQEEVVVNLGGLHVLEAPVAGHVFALYVQVVAGLEDLVEDGSGPGVHFSQICERAGDYARGGTYKGGLARWYFAS